MDRKQFLKKLSVGSSLLAAPNLILGRSKSSPSVLKPKAVKRGDVAAIVSPAGSVLSKEDIQQAIQSVRNLGLVPKLGKHVGERWGYLGGRDTERLYDLHQAFRDEDVKLIFPIRGGYGSSRLLPMIDFDLIKRYPKIFVGYSDNTSLIVSMNQMSGLVTFYGPNALSDWTPYTSQNWKRVLMQPTESTVFDQPAPRKRLDAAPSFVRISGGKARGKLLGGNLSLLIQTLGTEWEIDTRGKIIFFEDVNETPYKIDRMLTHLWLANKLQEAAGFAIGHITNVIDGDRMDVMGVIRDRFEPLGLPCYVGLTTGHVSNILTLPVGLEVELDADKGILRAVERAVS